MNKRILIVDDDRDFGRTMARQLEQLSGPDQQVTVEMAINSVEATMKVNLNTPDLICLDVDLSQENGLAFCEYLAWNRELQRIPIVVMTNRHDLESIQRSSSLELHFVDKSIDSWDEFLDTIRGIMRTSKSHKRVLPSAISPMTEKLKHIDLRLSGPFASERYS